MTPHSGAPRSSDHAVTRRSFITGASVAVPLLAFGASGASADTAGQLSAAPLTTTTAGTTSAYAHPGLVHTLSDIERVSAQVKAGTQPWLGGWDRLVANGRSGSGWQPRPVETVVRGGDGSNYGPLFTDIHAAYQNALRWRISGEAAHGAAAVRILNSWSGKLTTVTGNADRFLAAGIYGYQFANAAELVRDHPDFEFERFRGMLLNIFHPMNEHFLTNHNGAVITNYWANWDLCNMASVLAIGIFADRDDLVDRAVTYFQSGAGNGSLPNAVPYVYEDEGLAQWQESGRDQAHSMMGIGLMGAFCEMAWNQGIDCYGHDNNRFLKAAEYVAKYNLGNDVPFTPYTWQSGPKATTAAHAGWQTQTVPGEGGRGQGRPVWDQVLGHYSGRKGLSTPWVSQIAATLRPDGGGGDYGPNSGGYDALGFGTLMQYRILSPLTPPTTPAPMQAGTLGTPAPMQAGAVDGTPPTQSAPAAPTVTAQPTPETTSTAPAHANGTIEHLADTGTGVLPAAAAGAAALLTLGGAALISSAIHSQRTPPRSAGEAPGVSE